MDYTEISIRAANFSNTMLIIAILKHLRSRGILSQDQITEIGDDALQMLELLQMGRPTAEHPVYESARKNVEAMLPDLPSKP